MRSRCSGRQTGPNERAGRIYCSEQRELHGATKQEEVTLEHVDYSVGESTEPLALWELGGVDGEYQDRLSYSSADCVVQARKDTRKRLCGSALRRQPGERTGRAASRAVRGTCELGEERARCWSASGRMPDWSAGEGTPAKGEPSHSTPKGCAEDTGVLRCVKC
jgi:hypothetical protein